LCPRKSLDCLKSNFRSNQKCEINMQKPYKSRRKPIPFICAKHFVIISKAQILSGSFSAISTAPSPASACVADGAVL